MNLQERDGAQGAELVGSRGMEGGVEERNLAVEVRTGSGDRVEPYNAILLFAIEPFEFSA